jgi:ABC-type amino acid transport substrate-binding protein
VDLLDSIFSLLDLNTTYDIYLATDYGGLVNGVWNGMVKELLDGNADIALGDFTITKERMSVIDFTLPYLDVGLNILIPQPVNTINLWWIFSPFSPTLWACLVATALGMSIFIYLSDRLSPYGYHRSQLRSNMDKFDFSASCLGAIYIFLGNSLSPGRSWGGRFLMLFYLAFSFVVVSFYNADLTASLTVQNPVPSIQGLSDLAGSGFRFGTQNNSATEAYFRQPGLEQFLPSMVLLSDYNATLVALSQGIIQAVINDSPTQEYIVNNPPCDKWIVAGIFGESNFGMGIPLGNDIVKQQLSEAILSLRESGTIDFIYNTWWEVGGCNDDSNLSSSQLTFLQLSGAFALLALFMCIAIFFLFIENLYYRWYHDGSDIPKPPVYKHIDRFFGNMANEEEIRRAVEILLKKKEQKKKSKEGVVPLEEDTDWKVSY